MDEQEGFASLGHVDAWIDQLPDGVVVSNREGVITLANDALSRISAYPREELIGMPIDGLVPSRHRHRHGDLRNDFVAEGRSRPMGPGLQLQLERRDGELVPVEISLAPIGDHTTGLVLAIVRDISERRRADEALRLTNDLLSLASERERIARDLHDTVLQRLFGLGLELQALSMRAEPTVGARVEQAVDEIDLIIREIRTAVFTLGAASREGSFGQELTDVASQAKRVLGFAPRLRLDGPVESAMTPEIRTELLATLREALANVGRHAAASEAVVDLAAAEGRVTLRVNDNGKGIPASFDTSSGNGLRNMAERARLLGGDCAVRPGAERGTELVWWVPLPS